jgi:hypothetical protein
VGWVRHCACVFFCNVEVIFEESSCLYTFGGLPDWYAMRFAKVTKFELLVSSKHYRIDCSDRLLTTRARRNPQDIIGRFSRDDEH